MVVKNAKFLLIDDDAFIRGELIKSLRAMGRKPWTQAELAKKIVSTWEKIHGIES